MKNSKLYVGLASGLVVGGLVGSLLLPYTGGSKVETVATVDGKKITSVDLYDSMKGVYGTTTLENLISDRLIDIEIKKNKIKVSDKDVQNELDVVIMQYGSEEKLTETLSQSNRTINDLKGDIKKYVQMKKLLESRVTVSDEEITKYYEENKEEMAQKEQVKASHILVADEKTAIELEARLKDGADFTELAKQFSTDSSSKESGGDLGYFGKGDMIEEFEKAAFALKVGEISEPVKSEHGYHIIKVTDKQEAKEASLEKSKEYIKDTLKDQKMDSEYPTWLEEMKSKYEVKNNLNEEK